MVKIQQESTDIYQKDGQGRLHRPPDAAATAPTGICDREAELMRCYGDSALAFFGLDVENGHFLASRGAGLVNYRLMGNVALALGDPICMPEACEDVTRGFLDFCALHHWRAAFYQARHEHLVSYRVLKLHAFKMGEEAIINPQTFTLSGSALANVRTSCRRAEREGVTISWYEGVPPPEAMHQLEHVSRAWFKHKTGMQTEEMGFSVGRLDELIDIAERADSIANIPSHVFHTAVPRLVTAVAMTSAGTACAFVTFTPIYGFLGNEAGATARVAPTFLKCRGDHVLDKSALYSGCPVQGWGWALDLMRRAPDAPPGVMELLLVRAIERFQSCGAQVVSLGMVALADTRQEMTPGQRRLVSFVADRLHLFERRGTLFNFKQKFHPCWESRYLVANTTLALPKIALAVLRVRNYSAGGVARLITRTC